MKAVRKLRIVKEGDSRQVVCSDFGLTHATYNLCDINFSEDSGVVKNLLAAVCDSCGKVASIPK